MRRLRAARTGLLLLLKKDKVLRAVSGTQPADEDTARLTSQNTAVTALTR